MVMAGNHVLNALQVMKANGAAPPLSINIDESDGDWLIPIVDVSHLTRTKAEAYAVADNRTSELGKNDATQLSAILHDLKTEIDLDSIGYSVDDLESLMAEVAEIEALDKESGEDPGPAPIELVDHIRISRGDVWLLGNHRIMCGDSTSLEDVRILMDGKKADLCATDPPYLVDYTGDDRPREGKDWSSVYHEVEIKDRDAFFRSVFANVLEIGRKNIAVYCWHAEVHVPQIRAIWEAIGIRFHQSVIWAKPLAAMTYNCYSYQHEPCLMGWRAGGGKPAFNQIEPHMTTLWSIDWDGKARHGSDRHPTEKPTELFAIPMRKHTKPGAICFEPFSGSGSQIIAAEKESRRCYAMEIEPVFCEVAIRRWEEMTGLEAVKVT